MTSLRFFPTLAACSAVFSMLVTTNAYAVVGSTLRSTIEAAQPFASIYTDLTTKTCVVTEEADQYVTGPTYECPGVGGYKLRTYDFDLRSELSVVAPNGKEYPLHLPSVIHPAYSVLGARAEWRVIRRNGKVIPKALIVRYTVSQSPEVEGGEFKDVHYLAVTGITPTRICVTDRISASSTMNVLARKAAATAPSKTCLPFLDLDSL